MRTLKNFMLLVMTMSLVSLTSCKSDDDGGGPGTAASGTLVATVDGVAYQSVDIASSATIANSGQNLIIIAANSEGNSFSMTIAGYSGPGTYPLGGGANIFNVGSYQETMVDLANPQNSTTEIWQAPYDDTQVGEINISDDTDNVIGTFEFSAQNVAGDQSIKTITNGSFDLTKQVVN
ncbi:DUF6252 family protein [Ichthyenterobacterium sp. W332]|uniref:DUF6252 family protein n=1 Tax=Microcosmobacter mediterraneus TaxID=3075607 RepID=A0ABU2YG03_9FLAO|nr:DUF6252 family protein [Ichthyenterobacterium sp. W332]MDT0557107.1 DUF6252 family protein [Ichthyenterobacterium sp. W332]